MANENIKFYVDKFSALLFSRIILKKLNNETIILFRKLEKHLKICI